MGEHLSTLIKSGAVNQVKVWEVNVWNEHLPCLITPDASGVHLNLQVHHTKLKIHSLKKKIK